MTPELHLTEEQLSALVEGAISSSDRALLQEHVRKCEQCHAAFTDAVRYRGIWETDATVFRAPDAYMELAASIPESQPAAPAAERPRKTWWPALAPALATAAVVVLVAAVAVWRPFLPNQHDARFSAAILGPIQAAVADASTAGAIVIPGGEAAAATALPMHRSGIASPDPAVVNALRQLTLAYRDNSASPDAAHWLISGFLATGQLENARVYAQDARLRFPDDVRFALLDALVAYRSRDMSRAERLLQLVLHEDPHNGAALINLGLVQYEQGQWDAAKRTFEMARSRFAGSPLETRAATLISELLNG